MQQPFLSYWFWPNPGGWTYTDPKVQAVLAGCGAFLILFFAIRFWRSRSRNPITKNLSAGWPTAAISFGIVALILAISRVETIQFISMRAVWVVWLLSLAAYVVFQVIKFRRKHYVVIQRERVIDERDKYLPRKKR